MITRQQSNINEPKPTRMKNTKISEKYQLRKQICEQINVVNNAKTILERMSSIIELYKTVNGSATIIKNEIRDLSEVIIQKSRVIITEIQEFINTQPDLLEDEMDIMREAIDIVSHTYNILVCRELFTM